MDILSNIWNALCTENPQLLENLYFPLLLIESYMILIIFSNVLNLKSTRKQRILYVLAQSISGLITQYGIPSPYNIFMNYIFVFSFVYVIFEQNSMKSLIAVIVPTLSFVLTGTLILNPILKLANITSYQLNIIPIYRLIYLALMYSIILVFIFLLKYKKLKINMYDEIDKKNKSMLLLNFSLGLLAIAVQLLLTFYYINTYPIVFTILNFISLIAYFSISLFSLNRINKLMLTTRDLQNAEAYNNSLSILYDNVKGFKHDFDNIVSTIGGYVRNDDLEGLKKYYIELEDDCKRVNNIAILNPNIINNPGIFNLLSIKYKKASEMGIQINLEFFLDLNTINMKIYDFSRILGILLDNSIEAASECDEKVINIIFRKEDKNNRQIVIIENTFYDKNINTNEIFKKGVSGKENHTGLGLWEVREIIKRNNNINLFTNKTDKYFKQQLEIYY